MKAVRLFEHGGPEVLQYIDCDLPVMGDDDVLIAVRATAINSWDLRYRTGKLPPQLPGRPGWPMPFQLGRDAAGEIVDVGKNVKKWKVGDRVAQMPHPACGHCTTCLRGHDNLCINTSYPGHQVFGGYAEYISRSQDAILGIPENVSYESAAATLWTYTTPLNCATRRAPVGPGDTVVITGASGGMASACLQLAQLFGAKTIGITTKIGRADDLLALGYDHVLDYTDAQTPDRVRQLTYGRGADAVWDCVGGSAFMQFSIKCLRLQGTIGVIATGAIEDDQRNVEVPKMGFIALEFNLAGVRGATRRDQQLCMELLGENKISPVIDRIFPLSAAVDSHIYLESQQQIGKILLIPDKS